MSKLIMTKLGDLLAQPRQRITLTDVLDAVRTYSPEYMHGIPKKEYIRCLERIIGEPV